jgi:hypothetical protein
MYTSLAFAAGGGESGSAAWDASGFFGGSAGAGIAGACCTGLGATPGLFRSINSACFIRFFASANRTGTTRFSKDYELRHDSVETMINIAFAHQLLRRAP